jgi:hypothetical protein
VVDPGEAAEAVIAEAACCRFPVAPGRSTGRTGPSAR